MVAQAAVPLAMLASSMGLSIPAVIDYFKGQNIDLSGYGANDLVDIETIFPRTESQRIKEFKTYEDSFYTPKPVTENTDLSDIILQTKKDDDEKITTIDQEGNVLPDLPDQMPEPDPEDNDPKKTVITTSAEAVAEELAKEGTDKIIKDLTNQYKKIDQQRKNFLTDSDPQTEDTSVETINPKDFF